MKKHRKKLAVSEAASKPTNFAVVGLVTLLVARPLVPEDPGGQAGYGVAFILMWLLLAIGWIVQQWRANQPSAKPDLADLLLLALIGWHTLASVVAAMQGSPRPAVNMLWEFVCIGLVFLLARRILVTGADTRGVVAVMVGLALGLSLMAMEQRFVSMPQDLRAFESVRDDPAQLYALTGQWLPPGSSELGRFESRLLSQQPTATFALTNSLAGFLVPWTLLLTAILLGGAFRRTAERPRVVIGGIALVAILFTLALTGSRTALLATISGLAAISFAIAFRSSHRRITWMLGALLLVIGMSGAFLAWQYGLGDGAMRSVAFRVEYWKATLDMIADHPFVGCGPGQFQDVYTKYKLPMASEEIQDPHNWLLEVTATAGIPAGVLLVALLVVVAWRTACNPTTTESTPEVATADRNEPLIGAVCGLTLGMVLAFMNGFAPTLQQFVLIAVGVSAGWWVLRRWVSSGKLDAGAVLIALAALLLNLTASGGIGYPSVADSLWLLAAIGIGVSGVRLGERAKPASGGMWVAMGGVCATLFVIAYLTAFRPVTISRAALVRADSALLSERPSEYADAVVAAAAADPWSAQAALQLASLRLAEYEQRSNSERLDSVSRAVESMLRLSPQKSEAWVRASEVSEALYRKTNDPQHLRTAVEYQRQAIDKYPTSAQLHARLAHLSKEVGDPSRAAESAREALRLDRLMQEAGHRDRQLPAEELKKLHELAGDSGTFDAEKPPPVQ